METTQISGQKNSDWEIANQLKIIRWQLVIAAREIWINPNDIALEAVYTKLLLDWYWQPWKKTSIKLLMKKILSETQTFTDLESFADTSTEDIEVDGSVISKAANLKKLIWSEWYDRLIKFYWTHRQYKSPDWSGRDYHRFREWIMCTRKKWRIRKMIEKSPELQEVFA